MKYTTTREVGNRVYNSVSRMTLDAANDQPLLQELKLRGFSGEAMDTIEHAHPYGFTAVPKNPTTENGVQKRAEAFVTFLSGNRSHGVAISTSDRRYRPNNLKEGEVVNHDDQLQQVYFSRDRIVIDSTKEIAIQRGDAHVLLTSGKVKIQYGQLSVTITNDKILLGSETKATHAVLTADGPSTKVFAVLDETDSAMTAAATASRTAASTTPPPPTGQ
jgi:phage gp45-like